jgi:hypothetical protein
MNRIEQHIRFNQLLAQAEDGYFPIHEKAKARFGNDHIQKLFGNSYVNDDRVAKAAAWISHVIENKTS